LVLISNLLGKLIDYFLLGKTDFDNQIRHRGWLGGTLDKQGYGWLLDTTNDDDDPNTEENRPLL
jgi:hypothetical protein